MSIWGHVGTMLGPSWVILGVDLGPKKRSKIKVPRYFDFGAIKTRLLPLWLRSMRSSYQIMLPFAPARLPGGTVHGCKIFSAVGDQVINRISCLYVVVFCLLFQSGFVLHGFASSPGEATASGYKYSFYNIYLFYMNFNCKFSR